jgi:hypothetical protein
MAYRLNPVAARVRQEGRVMVGVVDGANAGWSIVGAAVVDTGPPKGSRGCPVWRLEVPVGADAAACRAQGPWGRLAVLPNEDVPPDGLILTMSAVWPTKSPPGPAGRWFVDRLKQIPVEAETAGRQKKAETICENLIGRRCPHRWRRHKRGRVEKVPVP